MNDQVDIAVVGAGLAGLIAARLAMQQGARVVVLEPHAPGGRAQSADHEGFLFNRGPHALYLGGDAKKVLARLGIDPPGGSPPGNLAHALRGSDLVPLPATARGLLTSPLLGVRSRLAVTRLFARLPRLDPSSHAHQTVLQWLDDTGLTDDARQLVLLLTRVASYSNAPDLISADVAIMQLQRAFSKGVRYLDGGWQHLVDTLARGVPIDRATALKVTEDGDDVRVETDGEPVRARKVIVAVGGPAATSALLPNHRGFDVGPPIEACCLDLGTRHRADPPLVFGLDRPLYLSTHCPPAQLAPPGHSVVQVAQYLPMGHNESPEADRAELEALAHRAGIRDEDVVVHRFLRRQTVVGAMPTPDHGGLAGRPPVGVDGYPGVFICGDWVGAEGFLADASAASAAEAVRLAYSVVPV
jgi:phytoene dehydrogenase-like protein